LFDHLQHRLLKAATKVLSSLAEDYTNMSYNCNGQQFDKTRKEPEQTAQTLPATGLNIF